MIYPGDLDTRYGTSFQGHVMIPMKNSISTSYLQWSSLSPQTQPCITVRGTQ